MATPEALIKYYDCLKGKFNEIQNKDNETALVNAALRPKIRDELVKSKDVLDSYLNYIQVFSLIYTDKFLAICNNIIVPLFKEIGGIDNEQAVRMHETVHEIIKTRPELADDFVTTVVKVFPSVISDENEINEAFLNFLMNCLQICTYIDSDPLLHLMSKILEKINPPPKFGSKDELKAKQIRETLDKSYKIVIEFVSKLGEHLEKFTTALIKTFTREFLSHDNQEQMKYLLLYICSLSPSFPDLFLDILWNTFTDPSLPLKDRQTSITLASSYISRANYIQLDVVFNFLEKASKLCKEYSNSEASKDDIECFHALAQSIFYLITQRYREMYEEENIARLVKLDLDEIIKSSLRPLESCDPRIELRFQEVASLYQIASPIASARKKQKRTYVALEIPFGETNDLLPDNIKPLYRNYYDHRNFTVYRE